LTGAAYKVMDYLRVEIEDAFDRKRLADAAHADNVEPCPFRSFIRRLVLLAILIECLERGGAPLPVSSGERVAPSVADTDQTREAPLEIEMNIERNETPQTILDQMVADVIGRAAVRFIVLRVARQANRRLVVGQHRRQSLDQRVAVIIGDAGLAVFSAHCPPLDDQDTGWCTKHGIRNLHCLFHSLSRSSRMRLIFDTGGT
jgi:hypothetical protein